MGILWLSSSPLAYRKGANPPQSICVNLFRCKNVRIPRSSDPQPQSSRDIYTRNLTPSPRGAGCRIPLSAVPLLFKVREPPKYRFAGSKRFHVTFPALIRLIFSVHVSKVQFSKFELSRDYRIMIRLIRYQTWLVAGLMLLVG